MKILNLILLSLILTACSTGKIKVKPNVTTGAKLALLPIISSAEKLSEAKTKRIRQDLNQKLAQVGYLPLSLKVVDQYCEQNNCQAKQSSIKNLEIDALAELNITSFSGSSFGLGKTNKLAGTLFLYDVTGQEFYQSKQSAIENSGILFESGQLVKAFKEADVSAETSFSNLSEEFIDNLTEKVPKPVSIDIQAASTPEIKNISTQNIRKGLYRICASSDPESNVYLIYHDIPSKLRPVSKGRFCGIYNLVQDDNLKLNVVNRFGAEDTKEINLNLPQTCSLKEHVKANVNNQTFTINANCPDYKLEVYQTESRYGPYKRLGAINNVWSTNSYNSNAKYYVFAKHPVASLNRIIEVKP